ncbi:MAG TPA: DUF6152 family protein [Candidatus Acidoferrales bacterium]|nr:DUF6152 family protein [Candidatus Acidoferrales bacterium]
MALPVGVLVLCGAVFAHHGSASYKSEKVVVLKEATVTRFLWANPHAMVLFDVKDEQGNTAHWAGEAGSPAAIRPLGWSKNSVRPGDVITVQVYPSKFESDVGRVVKIVFADGSTLKNSPRTDRGEISRY